jgi:tRNA uridine 5-carbamoylmethylation protein Kti12
MKNGFIIVGVSGSGKSTIVEQLKSLLQEDFTSVFSLDNCRRSFMDEKHTTQWWSDVMTNEDIYNACFQFANENEKEFAEYVTNCWMRALTNENVIVDNTNLTRKSRARWVNDLRAKKANITAIQVITPLNTVIARQMTRKDKSVPEKVVREMYMRQQEILLGAEADKVLNVDGTADNSAILKNFFK